MTAETDVSITARLGAIDRNLQLLARARDPLDTPSMVPFSHHVAINASAAGLIDLGGPTLGYEWRVRHCTVSDNSAWSKAAAGTAQFCNAISTETAAVTVRPNHVIQSFTALPNAATFGPDEFAVTYGEHVLCLVTSGTPGQLIQASIKVQLFTATSRRASVVI